MSQHSAAASTTFTNTTTTTSTTTTAVTTNEESSSSSAKPGSSSILTGSLKKQKHKDATPAEVPLTDDFVLHIPPDNFKDKAANETNAVKRHCIDSSPASSSSALQLERANLECLLLSDSSVESGVIPVHVQTLLQQYDDNSQLTQAEILLILVYIVALESGFVAAAHYAEHKLYLHHLSATSTFHVKNILYLSHHKPKFLVSDDKTRFTLKLRTLIEMDDDDDTAEALEDNFNSLLTAMVTGDFLIVTLTPSPTTNAKGFSFALSMPRYILSMPIKNKPLYQRFRKLPELSYNLREHLFNPMRCQQLNLAEFCIYPSLADLPVDLYKHIFHYLYENELNILANVNKSLHHLVVSVYENGVRRSVMQFLKIKNHILYGEKLENTFT